MEQPKNPPAITARPVRLTIGRQRFDLEIRIRPAPENKPAKVIEMEKQNVPPQH